MKGTKKIIAFALTLVMVLSMSGIAMAASMEAAEKAEILGILKGDGSGVTEAYLAKSPTRIQAVIISLRLKGLEELALKYEGDESFTDQNDIGWEEGKTIASYVKAHPELGWIGSNGALMPNETITAQQFVKVMLESLGYAQGTDFEWVEVFTFAESIGLTALDQGTIMTNESLAEGMIDALAAETKGGTTLVEVLIKDGAIKQGVAMGVGLVEVEAEDSDFELLSVEPFGLNAVKIMFTSPVDEDEDIEIEVEDEDGDDVTLDTDFTIDGKVIIVVFGGNDTEDYTWSDSDAEVQKQSTDLDLVISATGTDGFEVDEEEASVTMEDKENPEVIAITAEDAKTMLVVYSEPISPSSYERGSAVFDEVFIDGDKVVGQATWSEDFTTITYVLNDAIDAGTYAFTSEAVKDFAGFVADSKTASIKVVGDNDAPQLEEVEFVSTTELVLVFDEDVEDIGDIEVDGDEVASYEIEDNEITITLDEDISELAAYLGIEISWEDVEDAFGNKEDGNTEFLAPKDEEQPTLEIEVSSDNELVFIFSEEVTGFDVDDISLYDDEDDEVSGFFSGNIKSDERDIDDYEDEDEDEKIYYLLLDDPDQASGEYTIEIDGSDSGITDLSVLANELEDVEESIEFNDKEAPEIKSVLIIDGNWEDDGEDETIRIGFSEAMDMDTLEDEDNYIIDGTPLDDYDDYEISADNEGLFLDITIEGLAFDGLTISFFGLEDEEGNDLKSGSSEVIEFADASFSGVDFELTDFDEITVTLSGDSFADADPDDFVLYEADGTTEVKELYVINATIDKDDDSLIVLKLSDDLMADGSVELTEDGSLKVKVAVEAGDTVNAYDVPLKQSATVVTDKVDPSVEASFEDDDKENVLYVRFDEAVVGTEDDIDGSLLIFNEDTDAYEDASDLGLMFYDVDDDSVNGNTEAYVYFTIELKADASYEITLLSKAIEDTSGNTSDGLDKDTYYPE